MRVELSSNEYLLAAFVGLCRTHAAGSAVRETFGGSDRFCADIDFQRTVLEAARALGWRTAHFRPARTARGWRTLVEGEGFPRLVLLRGERLLVRELKVGTARLSRERLAWLEGFRAAGVDAGVWRDDDWDAIEDELRRSA